MGYWKRKEQFFTYSEPFSGAQWNLWVGLFSQVMGQGQMASRGGSGWILGKNSALNGWLSVGGGVVESPILEALKNEGMWHLVMWIDGQDGILLEFWKLGFGDFSK